ncbi:NHL repeat-containing protein [Paraflavitalea soli]|uniref:hypothetical protein n=1 Tax=Paraflavitalea soli TaxID=2315862 RepID=UPI0013C4ECC6|nr:hypothetical protein [Paraflavitalea soli]
MKRHYRYFFLVPVCLVMLLFSCKKVDDQLRSIESQPGVYDLSPGNAFPGDTVKIRGKFHNDPDLRFFFNGRPARIVGKGTETAYPTGSQVYDDIPIPLEYYFVVVPDSISGSVPVTAVFGGLTFPVGSFGVRQPPPLVAGNVWVSTYAGRYGATTIKDDSLHKAEFGLIQTMVVQPDGTIYTADFDPDTYKCFVRKVADGKVTTIAGGGTEMEGPGLDVGFGEIKGMAVDAKGDIYIAERTWDANYWSYSRITKLDHITHEVSLFAGRVSEMTDTSMINDGPRLSATFFDIGDISFDATGKLYVADYSNYTIRVISKDGIVSSPLAVKVCDGGFCSVLSGYEDGFGQEARLSQPEQLAVAPNGRVYFTEFYVLRELNPPSLEVNTIAGFPNQNWSKQGPLSTASFYQLRSVAPDAEGNLLVVDGSSVLKIDLTERYVYVLAGGGPQGYTDGKGEDATFNQPAEVGFDAKGNFYVADRVNRLIRKITVQK